MREDEFVAASTLDSPMVAKYNAVLHALVPSFGGGPVQALEYERLCERNLRDDAARAQLGIANESPPRCRAKADGRRRRRERRCAASF